MEEEEQEEGDEGGEEEESLLLLSRSLAAACSLKGSGTDSQPEEDLTIRYVRYESELQMPDIMRLITKDLSEPYSIYTYRYFIHNWPQLCFLVSAGEGGQELGVVWDRGGERIKGLTFVGMLLLFFLWLRGKTKLFWKCLSLLNPSSHLCLYK